MGGRIIADERYKHFHGEHRKAMLELKEARAKAADYLRQLSFASRVRDATWIDGLHLRFESFRTWWKDPSWKIDLNLVQIEDIPYTSDAIRRLTSLGQKEMPDVAWIADFDYHSPAKDPEAFQGSPERCKDQRGG